MIILDCRCLKSDIQFNTDALEKLVYEPEWALENEEVFWSTFPAQKNVRRWSEKNNLPIDYKGWRKTMKEWIGTPIEKRKNMDFLRNAERIIQEKQVFIEKVLPYICSYLPEETVLDISIYFTAYIPPRAIAMEEIVINMTATYWNNNPNNILNAMVHELFHVGYDYCEKQRDNEVNDDPFLNILKDIHNEGVCTYIGYMAQGIFPAPDEKDYHMLDNPSEVKRHLKEVKNVLSKVGKISEDKLKKLIWDVGVVGRSFYVTGAHMSRVIMEKTGKENYKQTLLDGPEAFFKIYNNLVTSEAQLSIS